MVVEAQEVEEEADEQAEAQPLEELGEGVAQAGGDGNAEISSSSGSNVANMAPKVTGAGGWRKDLKIAGQIGDPKRGLAFISLVRQIDSALLKGYSEKEVIEAVIRAIQTGSRLRSYVEGRLYITLPVLRKIIRSHYREKTSSDLYQELTNLCQGSKEDTPEFLQRALDIRQKILFASKESDSSLKCDEDRDFTTPHGRV